MQTSDHPGEKQNKLAELKQGKKIYDINNTRVVWYTYLCVHPSSSYYHILIDSNEDPLRIWDEDLLKILHKDLTSYDKARLALADVLEKKVKDLRTRATHIESGTKS